LRRCTLLWIIQIIFNIHISTLNVWSTPSVNLWKSKLLIYFILSPSNYAKNKQCDLENQLSPSKIYSIRIFKKKTMHNCSLHIARECRGKYSRIDVKHEQARVELKLTATSNMLWFSSKKLHDIYLRIKVCFTHVHQAKPAVGFLLFLLFFSPCALYISSSILWNWLFLFLCL
jgi:hypothetical protein